MFEQAETVRQVTGKGSASVAGGSGDFEVPSGGAGRDGLNGQHEADPRISNRRDIEMIGVLTERLANCERREAEARRETEEAQARLKEQHSACLRALTRIEQLEFELGYLRAEGDVLRAAARRGFHAGSATLNLKLAALQEREEGMERLREEIQDLRAQRRHTDDLIRRLVPRRLRKRVRKFLFGSAETY